jgi:hypothetical protein
MTAIRGRVIDTEGRPVPDAAVGRWLTFDVDGTGEMLRFFGGAVALTDREGNFVIAPRLDLSFGALRPAPKVGALCFADPSFHSDGWLLFRPDRPIRMAFQVFDQNRVVEPVTVTLKPSRRIRIPIFRGFVTPKRETQYDSQILVTLRKNISHYDFLIITASSRAGRWRSSHWCGFLRIGGTENPTRVVLFVMSGISSGRPRFSRGYRTPNCRIDTLRSFCQRSPPLQSESIV